jgi:hypothetical protein
MPAKTTKDEETVRIARTSKTGATGLRPANDTTLRFAPRGSISRFVSYVDRDGGKTQKIWRCPTCQVAVFSQYTRRQVRFVRGGTLDEPAAVAPDVHIYTRSKLPWVTLPEYAPAFEVYYDVERLWPAVSLERLGALMASAGADA